MPRPQAPEQPAARSRRRSWLVVVLVATVLLVVLSYRPIENLFSHHQLMNASFNRWQLVNTYGAFGTVTKRRIEIVVEGTLDEDPGDDADWREYGFKGKPGDVRRIPRQYAPYHLRLDWLMWFLPLRTVHEEWFYAFLAKLLAADRPTLRLLRHDPFDGERPHWVRATQLPLPFLHPGRVPRDGPALDPDPAVCRHPAVAAPAPRPTSEA